MNEEQRSIELIFKSDKACARTTLLLASDGSILEVFTNQRPMPNRNVKPPISSEHWSIAEMHLHWHIHCVILMVYTVMAKESASCEHISPN
ncbi:MAG: hypothetical protein E6J34_09450 [Chloroflexi bacterium]|nr:MAG: hypothetical protein E6J34_09450 [Chloroflexota bacterium]